MNLYIKLSILLILEIGRLLFIFPYESLEMSGEEKPIGSIVRSHYMDPAIVYFENWTIAWLTIAGDFP